ncbi:MAG: class I SAM-dependent methyltransferase [Eubacteriales bacterium]|nr:class I SAM-dependent methyltransferase [Eubacteriales bacterium]
MDYMQTNKAAWEEAFENRHSGWGEKNADMLCRCRLPFFVPDAARELEKIDFRGKRIAQFCCNNGRELLSLMKMGAEQGTGFDFAENIIGQARDTAQKAGINNCEFIVCNALEIDRKYSGGFDFILFTIGAITWFDDLNPLFAKVSDCLRSGGLLFINDYHPFMGMLPMPDESGYDARCPNRIVYRYFRKEPWIENNGMDYMSRAYRSKTFTSFQHTMSDVVNSVIDNGMRVNRLNEYDYDIGLSDAYDNRGLPLSYILLAEKPGNILTDSGAY